MKSHQYASKRRLTNICCWIVSFGLIKLVFVAYFMAGGEFFEFSAKKELSPKSSIIAQEQKLQKKLEENTRNNTLQNNLVAQNTSAEEKMKNTVLASNSRVSFLPKSQNNDKNLIQDKKNQTTPQSIATAPVSTSSTALPLTHTSAANQIVPQSKYQNAKIKPVLVAENSPTQVERNDLISSDSVLASASSATANIARAKKRANLVQNAFGPNVQDNVNALEGVENQQSNYKTQNSPQNQESNTKEKSSFFSFVKTAHAAEEAYVRPDENFSIAVPAPKVAPYSSPESEEYKQAELNRKEEELISLQQQMNSRMEELNELEGRIGTMVQNANNAQSSKYQHLIDTYVSMKAKRAAEALVKLDAEIAVRILNGMKGKQSGEIFSYMDPTQAARLSKAMTELHM